MVLENGLAELKTNITGPLDLLERIVLEKCHLIEDWFKQQWQAFPPPVYGSVDLRNAGFKLAPIDMNLFPAGFNNLNPNFLPLAIKAAQKVLHQLVPTAKNILLIPEAHTRNLYYWENIRTLQRILLEANFQVRLGLLNSEELEIVLGSGEKLLVEAMQRKNDHLQIAGFEPDVILLNNDLSDGIPEVLQNLHQPIIPPAELGWSQRLKSEHFHYYAQVCKEFAEKINIDPWLISPLFQHCGKIDFMQQEGSECLIANAEKVFAELEKKYAEYNIPNQPFLIVKADAGTYGMAVMTVRNVDELRNLNRKQRTRMATTKGGQPVRSVIIQEGVYTFETWGEENSVAEPVVYLWGNEVIGGFYRVHKDKGVDENLNAPGMQFEPIAFSRACNEPCDTENRFYLYGIIAQLSMLAAAREIKQETVRKEPS